MKQKRRKVAVIENLLLKIKNIFNDKLYFGYTSRIIIMIILFILISFSSLLILNRVFKFGKQEVISYKETGTTDYKVYLKSNTFYEKDYLEKDMMYVASLIKNINLNFNYSFTATDKLDYVFTYDVIAKINITNAAGTSVIFEKEYPLKENQRVETNNSKAAHLKENVVIDYDYYNRLANSFKTTYDIEPVSNLIIYLKVNRQVSQDKEILNVGKDDQMQIVIPLTQKTVDISIDESKIDNEGNATKSVAFSIKNIVLISITTVLMILAILIFIEFIELVSFLRPQKSKYDKRVKQILKNNDRYVVTSKTNLDFSSKVVIKVNTFDELMDVRDSLKLPIVYHSLIEHHECEFYLQSNDVVYVYNLKSIELDKEEIEKEEKQETTFNKVYRGEFADQKDAYTSIVEPIEQKQEEIAPVELPVEPIVSIPDTPINPTINVDNKIISPIEEASVAPSQVVGPVVTPTEEEAPVINQEIKQEEIDSAVFNQNIVLPNIVSPIEEPASVVESSSEWVEPIVKNETFIFEPPVVEQEPLIEPAPIIEPIQIQPVELIEKPIIKEEPKVEVKEEKQFKMTDIIPPVVKEDNVEVKKVEIPDIELNVENFKFEEADEELQPVFSFNSILPRFKETVDKVITKTQEEIYEEPFYIEQPDFDPEYIEPSFEKIDLSEETKTTELEDKIINVEEPIIEEELIIEDLLKQPEYEEPTLDLIQEETPKEEILEVKETKKMEFDDDINKIIEERVEKLVKKKLNALLKEQEKEKEEPKKTTKTTTKEEKVKKEKPKKEEAPKKKAEKKEEPKVEAKEEKQEVKKETPKEEKTKKEEDPKKEQPKEEIKTEEKVVEELKEETPKKETKKTKTLVDYEKELEAILTRNFNKDE